MRTTLWMVLVFISSLFIVACASNPPEKTAETNKPYRMIAVAFKNINCFKGFSQNQQNANLDLCQKQAHSGQVCETSLFVHGQSAYDVCLRAPETTATHIINCLKGSSQNDQNTNSVLCRKSLAAGQICETNWNVHGQAIYDVCLMD